MTTDSIQLPPDSTGKKVRHERLTDVVTTTETNQPSIGDIIIGKTSGATGVFKGDSRSGSVIYYVYLTSGSFVNGEVMWDGVTDFATVVSSSGEIYTPAVHVTDPDQPLNIQKVDKNGAAFATFPEGTPQFDAYGRMQISQMQLVADYVHVVEDAPSKYFTDTVGSGSATHDPVSSTILYSIGTESGAKSCRVTNQYHPYKAGVSQLIYTTVIVGDQGKENCVREWGYFDDYNGCGVRLDGTTLKVFIRNSSTGSVVEQIVSQENWNRNKLNDSNISDFLLNVSKGNIYWIDMAWHGFGEVSIGVQTPDGRRIPFHVFENGNKLTRAFMAQATLPLTWAQFNTGVTASSSEMRVVAASVFTETSDLLYTGSLIHTSPEEPFPVTSTRDYLPFLSFKAKSLNANGAINTIIGMHETFDWASQGDVNLHVGIFVLPSETYLTGHRWSTTYVPATMLYVDIDATSMPQHQIWANAGVFTGSISGTTLTVSAISSGYLERGQLIQGTGVTADTRVVGYISAGNPAGVGTYILDKSQTVSSTAMTSHDMFKPIESFIAPANSVYRATLGDRIEKSFGLGGNVNVAEADKGVFVFAVKALATGTGTPTLMYTKYWKEVR